jgi:hypothetical protein
MPAPTHVYRCRCHGQPYTVCPRCDGQYCPQHWPLGCPRVGWHPAHGDTDAARGRRWQALQDAARGRPALLDLDAPDLSTETETETD